MRNRWKAARGSLVTVGWMTGVACAAAVLGSCGAQGTSRPPSAPAPAPASTAPPAAPRPAAETAGEAAVAAYQGMWQAMARAGQHADWRSPELDLYATGLARTSIIRSLYADHARHVVTRGAPTTSPVVRAAAPPHQPTLMLIEDCGDSTDWRKVDERTGQPAGDGSGGGRRFIRAEVERQPDGAWKVSRFAVRSVGSC